MKVYIFFKKNLAPFEHNLISFFSHYRDLRLKLITIRPMCNLYGCFSYMIMCFVLIIIIKIYFNNQSHQVLCCYELMNQLVLKGIVHFEINF